jgi:hypothetical protein
MIRQKKAEAAPIKYSFLTKALPYTDIAFTEILPAAVSILASYAVFTARI